MEEIEDIINENEKVRDFRLKEKQNNDEKAEKERKKKQVNDTYDEIVDEKILPRGSVEIKWLHDDYERKIK